MIEDRHANDELLRRWRDALLAELAVDVPALEGIDADVDAVLALAGVVAHGVVRPAAPLTAYLVGLAVGRATAGGLTSEGEAFAAAAARARALAATGAYSPPREP